MKLNLKNTFAATTAGLAIATAASPSRAANGYGIIGTEVCRGLTGTWRACFGGALGLNVNLPLSGGASAHLRIENREYFLRVRALSSDNYKKRAKQAVALQLGFVY